MPCGVHPAENSDDSSFFDDGRDIVSTIDLVLYETKNKGIPIH